MWRRKGDGKERCHVAVEEEGERELLSDPQHAEEVPRERERELLSDPQHAEEVPRE